VLEPRDLELLQLHLAVAGKSVSRILSELLHPVAQLDDAKYERESLYVEALK